MVLYLQIFTLIIVLITFIISITTILKINLLRAKQPPSGLEPIDPTKNGDNIDQQLKEEVLSAVLLQMFTIRNAVHKQTTGPHAKRIERAPLLLTMELDHIKKNFSNEQLQLLQQYTKQFNHYKNKYWITKDGKIKTVFSGDIDQKTGDVGKMIEASELLVLKLDRFIEEFQIGE